MTTLFKRKFRTASGGFCLLFIGFLLFTGCKKDKDQPEPPSSETSNSKIYVANEEGGSLSVIKASDNSIIKTIELTGTSDEMLMPHNVQVAPDGKSVWVTGAPMAEGDMEYALVIDPNTNSIIKKIELGTDLHVAHVVLDNNSTYAYISANEANRIYKINAATYAKVDSFDVGADHKPHGMRYYNGKLYVVNMDGMSMSVIDVSNSQITEVPLGGVAVQIAITPDGKYAFASLYDTKEVVRYSIQTGALARGSLPSGAEGPIQLYPTPDSKSIYVCDQGNLLGRPASNKVYEMHTDLHIMNSITVGNTAHGVVVSNDGKKAYITNSNDNTVSVIDIATNQVTATIPAGDAPNGISYWFETGGMP